MKTSKEMQLKIIDKIRENIEDNIHTMSGIEYEVAGRWYEAKKSLALAFNMNVTNFRLKPQTITINGVEIPKPLSELDIVGGHLYYCVNDDIFLYKSRSGTRISERGVRFVYKTKEEAIKASKALFGIEC